MVQHIPGCGFAGLTGGFLAVSGGFVTATGLGGGLLVSFTVASGLSLGISTLIGTFTTVGLEALSSLGTASTSDDFFSCSLSFRLRAGGDGPLEISSVFPSDVLDEEACIVCFVKEELVTVIMVASLSSGQVPDVFLESSWLAVIVLGSSNVPLPPSITSEWLVSFVSFKMEPLNSGNF